MGVQGKIKWMKTKGQYAFVSRMDNLNQGYRLEMKICDRWRLIDHIKNKSVSWMWAGYFASVAWKCWEVWRDTKKCGGHRDEFKIGCSGRGGHARKDSIVSELAAGKASRVVRCTEHQLEECCLPLYVCKVLRKARGESRLLLLCQEETETLLGSMKYRHAEFVPLSLAIFNVHNNTQQQHN